MKLSSNFSLAEFTDSQIAARAGIDNTPDDSEINNLREVAAALEQVRSVLGCHPILISSGFRRPILNHLVRGAWDSAHMLGLAADFTCPAFGTPRDVALAIAASKIEFDQLICEGTWVHLGLAAGPLPRPRRQILTAIFRPGQPTQYISGLVDASKAAA
jgi:hypothetical protein